MEVAQWIEGRMANDLRARYQQFGIDYVIKHGRADADAVIDAVFEAFGDEIKEAWDRLSRESVRRDLKSAFKRLEEDADAVMQTPLPGFALPKVIAIPREGGVEYIHTATASRTDGYAARNVREMNIINAIRKRDEWDRVLDRCEVAWRINPDFTIGECIEHLAATQP